MENAPDLPTRSGANRTLAVVCAATFFGVLNASAINVLLPEMGDEFVAGPALVGWVVSLFLLVYGVAIPFYGRLADRYGTRPLFILGLGLFGAGCLACALAPTLPWLLAARVLQGLGGAAFPGLGMALVSSSFPKSTRGTALGFVAATMGVGGAVGPILGGVAADVISWRVLFAASGLAIVVIPVAFAVLPSSRAASRDGLDLPGGLLLAMGIAAGLFAVAEGGRAGWTQTWVLGALALAAASIGTLALRQTRLESPFLPKSLLASSAFRRAVLMAFCSTGTYLAILVGVPLMLARYQGLGPLHVGMVLVPHAVATAVTGVVAGKVVDRIGPRVPTVIGALGMVLCAFGFSVFAADSLVAIVALGVLLGASYALLNTPIAAAIASDVPARVLGSALSLNAMVFFIGGSFGTTAFVTLVEARDGALFTWNPLHTGAAVGFSDAFLVFALPMFLTAGLALGLGGKNNLSTYTNKGNAT